MFQWKSSDNPTNRVENDSMLDEEAKVKELREALGPLSGRSAEFCTDACLRRYLVTKNWHIEKAKKMLQDTLNWRAAYKPEEIRWEEVAHESTTGKCWRANFRDREGRTVLIMGAGKQNTKGLEGNVRQFVYMIENAILNLPEGQEQMLWMVDFSGFTVNSNLSVRLARETTNILQNHYPERLAVSFLLDPPKIFEAFFKVVKYFLNSSTSQKVKFVYPENKESMELMKSYFDLENLPKVFGGDATLEYNHELYSKLMIEDDKKKAKFWGFDDNPSSISTNDAAV